MNQDLLFSNSQYLVSHISIPKLYKPHSSQMQFFIVSHSHLSSPRKTVDTFFASYRSVNSFFIHMQFIVSHLHLFSPRKTVDTFFASYRQTPAYLPAQPRPLDLAGRLPSDVCLLPGPVGVCPANLGPHFQATGGSHGLSATIQPTWDHPVRPPAAPTACRRLSSPPGTTPSGHRGPSHPPTGSHTTHSWVANHPTAHCLVWCGISALAVT
jgi:hypothetical protein